MTTIGIIILGVLVVGGGWWSWRWFRRMREVADYGRQLSQMAGQAPNTAAGLAGVMSNLRAVEIRLRQLDDRANEETFGLQTLLASMVEGVVIIDSQGLIRTDNQAFRSMFAITTDPAGRRVSEVLRQPAVQPLIEHALYQHQPSSGELEYEDLLATDGRRKFFRLSVAPLGQGDQRGAVAVFHDLSRVVQLEGMRKEFVANVSHELRTPLSIFHGYLETLLSQPDLAGTAEGQRILQVMQRHSQRLNSLVTDLLTLSYLESGQARLERTPLHLATLFARYQEDWASKFTAKQCILQIAVTNPQWMVNADEFRLEQVFYNLLDNALKYSSANGVVELGAIMSEAGDMLNCYVRDHGSGIPSDKLESIFQRFFRVDKARSRELGGTGLGLAIVKHIVQSHGGKVWVESNLGKGTTIWLSLPVAAPDPA